MKFSVRVVKNIPLIILFVAAVVGGQVLGTGQVGDAQGWLIAVRGGGVIAIPLLGGAIKMLFQKFGGK